MNASTETLEVKTEGMTLDLLLWRRFRAQAAGLDTQVLDLNPGLARLGPVLPLGTKVIVPIPTTTPSAAKVVQLWE